MSSSSVVLQHRSQVSMFLSTMLLSSKDATRVWLRAEMDRTVDTVLHSIFNRLANKLVNADLGGCGHLNQFDHDPHQVDCEEPKIKKELDEEQTTNELINSNKAHKPDIFLSQTNKQSNHNLTNLEKENQLNLNHHQQMFNPHDHIESSNSNSIGGYEPEINPEILAQVKREIKEEQNEIELKNGQNPQIEEYEQEVTENLSHGQVMNNDTQHDWDEHEIEEEGDGQMMHIEEGVENNWDGDDAKEIEDNESGDNEESRTVEKVQIETTLSQPNRQTLGIANQSERHSKPVRTDELEKNEVNNSNDTEDENDDNEKEEVPSRSVKRPRRFRPTTPSSTKQIVTHTRRCPQCGLMFAQAKFNDHMKVKHSIGLFRCLVKDCRQSFSHNHLLGHHLAQSHQSTTEWLCDKCDNHYSTYKQLHNHHLKIHQLGHFQCSFPSCTFTGEYKSKVFNHYTKQHKPQTLNKCQLFGCHYETLKASDLKRHKRTHLDIKPYRCKWLGCDYSTVEKFKAINHIRRKHFALHPNGAQLDPNDYLDVVHQLL